MASLIPAAAGLAFRGLGALANRGARKKKEKQAGQSLVGQSRREEEVRSGRANIGAELLRGLGSAPAYGGSLQNPFGSLTPEMLQSLTRRQSDLELKGQITPAERERAVGTPGQSMLGGLFGGLADFTGRMSPEAMGGGGGQEPVSASPDLMSMLQDILRRGKGNPGTGGGGYAPGGY